MATARNAKNAMKIEIRFHARSCGVTSWAMIVENPPTVPIRKASSARRPRGKRRGRAAGRADENREGDDQQRDEAGRRHRAETHRLGADRVARLVLGGEARQRLDPVQVDREDEVAQLQRKELGLAWVPLGRRVRAVVRAVGDARAEVHEHDGEDERQQIAPPATAARPTLATSAIRVAPARAAA